MFCEYIGKEKNENGLQRGNHYFVYTQIKRNKLYAFIEGLAKVKKPIKCYKHIALFLKDWNVIDLV